MTMANGFRSAEEAALGLDLPLIGTLTTTGEIGSPVAATLPEDERIQGECRRIAEHVLAPEIRDRGPVGVVGDVAGPLLAQVTNLVAAASALMRPVVLVDADLSGAHLAFDTIGPAQEGLVDVLRYGVRAARLIAPTRTPGLSLLPVGAGTVDIEGTFASPAVEGLFEDLERAGELVLVNGPAVTDLPVAGPFAALVGGWILVHELAHSDPELSARIRDRLGSEKILGVVVVTPERAAEAPVVEAPTVEVPVAEEPTVEVPVVEEPTVEVPAVEAPTVEVPAEQPTSESAEPPVAAEAEPEPEPEPEPAPAPEPVAAAERTSGPAPRSRRGVLVAAIVVLVIAGVWSIRNFLPREPRPSAGPAGGEVARETIGPLDSIQALHSPASELVGVEAESIDTVATALVTGAQEEEPAREVEPPAPPEAGAAKTETPAAAELAEVYGVHVSSLTSEKDAWEDSERFYARGYSVAVRGEDVPGKGHWYRVYVGPFVEKEEASRVAAEVRESGLADYTRVRRLPASLFEQPQGGVRGER